jgi:hypothetical protein
MHKKNKSEAQLKHCSLSHPHATERIMTLRFAQRRKIALKIFLEGCRYIDYFDPLTTTQV